MGTKPAKVGPLGPWRPNVAISGYIRLYPAISGYPAIAGYSQIYGQIRSTGGPDLLKWGLPGGGVKSAKVAPTPYV